MEKGVRLPSGLLRRQSSRAGHPASCLLLCLLRLLTDEQTPRRGRCPIGSHKADLPGSIPGPGTCGRAGARPSFIRSEAVVRLPGPQLEGATIQCWHSMARYANWHSDQAESLMSVGSNPTRATCSSKLIVPWSNGDDTSLTKRKRGFDSLRDDSMAKTSDGPRVCWRHASVVRRGTEFDSRADLSSIQNGLLVQRDDTCLASRKSGFDSPAVH